MGGDTASSSPARPKKAKLIHNLKRKTKHPLGFGSGTLSEAQ